jgi:hypothetical protein
MLPSEPKLGHIHFDENLELEYVWDGKRWLKVVYGLHYVEENLSALIDEFSVFLTPVNSTVCGRYWTASCVVGEEADTGRTPLLAVYKLLQERIRPRFFAKQPELKALYESQQQTATKPFEQQYEAAA